MAAAPSARPHGSAVLRGDSYLAQSGHFYMGAIYEMRIMYIM